MLLKNTEFGIFFMAGAVGTRLKPLTDSIPKALLPVNCGRSIMDLWLEVLRQFKVKMFMADYIPPQQTESSRGLKSYCDKHDIKYFAETGEKRIGTANSIIRLILELPEIILLIYADVVPPSNIKPLIDLILQYDSVKYVASLLCMRVRAEDLSGKEAVHFSGKEIIDYGTADVVDCYWTGVAMIKPKAFFGNSGEEWDLARDVFPRLAPQKLLQGVLIDAESKPYLTDIGSLSSYLETLNYKERIKTKVPKRVLLIGPNSREPIFESRWCTAPLGVHRLASWLNKHGHEATVYDMNVDGKIEDFIDTAHYDIVGFSTLDATLENDLAIMHKIKKLLPEALLIAGGTQATLNYQVMFEKAPLDAVVLAEGEYPMLALCDDVPIQEIDGIVWRRYAKRLTAQQYEDINMALDIKALQLSRYWSETAKLHDPTVDVKTLRLSTSNFCPRGCAFCTLSRLRKYATGQPGKLLFLSAEKIVELLRRALQENPDISRVYFCDDDFCLDKNRVKEFCRLYQASGLKQVTFSCLTNLNCLYQEDALIDAMIGAGFRVFSIGAESMNQKTLDDMDKKQTPEMAHWVTDALVQRGVTPYYTLVLCSPHSTIEDLLVDMAGFRKLADMGAGLSIEHRLIPLRGTRYWEEAVPCRNIKIPIEGTNEYVVKPMAWLPVDRKMRNVLYKFEAVYPQFRMLRKKQDADIKHHDKNWQAHCILGCFEYVLKVYFAVYDKDFIYSRKDISDITEQLKEIPPDKQTYIDIVGQEIETGEIINEIT